MLPILSQIIQYFNKHNVKITEHNLKNIMNNKEQNNFIRIELI